MTTAPPAYWAPPNRWGVGRILGVVFGVLLLLPGLGLVVSGGILLWADNANREDGFVFSEQADFTTTGYALVSERIDLVSGADWFPISAALGTARAEVTSEDQAKDVFVGVAPLAEGNAYLDGVERSVINDLGTGVIDERFVPGGAPSGPPGDQDFWVAQVSGQGTQRLDWEPTQGDWLFVVMNGDGSPEVAMDARIGATLPALGGLAWGVLGTGIAMVLLGTLLLVLAIRRQRPGRAYSDGPYVMPSGSAPAWTPPAPTDRTTAADAVPDPTTTPRPPTT